MPKENSILMYRYPLSLTDDTTGKAVGRLHGSSVGHARYVDRETARSVAADINASSLLTNMTVSVIVHVKEKNGSHR